MANAEPPPLVTECPNCHTRFRVGESQLQMAHGRVRCGACLAVFAGVEHLLLDDEAAVPELPDESNMLESVLAELAGEDDEQLAEIGAGSTGAGSSYPSPARAYELDALASKREDTLEIAPQVAREPEREVAAEADWTSVSVDTQEFGPRITLELAAESAGSRFDEKDPEQSRVTIEDALNDEDALRWWLEDELPGEHDQPAGDDDGMVVQLSELDAVRDDDLDLRQLIGSVEGDSARQLEALFDELVDDPGAAANAAPQTMSETTDATTDATSGEQELSLEIDEIEMPGPAALTHSGESGPHDSEDSAQALQNAIDEAEPLVTRAMANGALVAAAEDISAALRADDVAQAADAASTPATPPAEKTEPPATVPAGSATAGSAPAGFGPDGSAEGAAPGITGDKPIALVKAPTPPPPVEPVTEPAGVSPTAEQAAQAEPEQSQPQPQPAAEEALSWNSQSFPETPAEMLEGVAEEMGRVEPDEPVPTPFERISALVSGALGNPVLLRAGTALAFVLLTGQILYSQFADWSKTAAMRPVYSVLCSALGCELPLRRSLGELQSRKLAVRSHPDKPNTLLVDALIINEAEYEQPFPAIELQFMDLQQQTVGAYRLEPAEYLDGELAGSNALMAVRTPVHIDIEIADPGPKAVNYQLQFR